MAGKLIIPQALFDSRRERLKRLIELNAPNVVLEMEARLFLRSFQRRSLREWLSANKFRLPHWLLCCIDKEYRQMCAEVEEG